MHQPSALEKELSHQSTVLRRVAYLFTAFLVLGGGLITIAHCTKKNQAMKERPPLEALRIEAPDHAAYITISHLIEQEHFQEALEQAVRLNELVQHTPSLQLLRAYNALRIACLHKELHNAPGELSAWRELEELLETASTQAAMEPFLRDYQRGQLSLKEYMTYRKEQLQSCSSLDEP